jgi:hypothetical protein
MQANPFSVRFPILWLLLRWLRLQPEGLLSTLQSHNSQPQLESAQQQSFLTCSLAGVPSHFAGLRFIPLDFPCAIGHFTQPFF